MTCARASQVPSRALVAFALVLALALVGCQPELRVGKWMCDTDPELTIPNKTDPVDLTWSTGFEDGFCDYAQAGGYCYSEPGASYEIVTSPVHSGSRAAAFHIDSSDRKAHQTRCVRQGQLPTEAFYGAWYFVPESVKNEGLWNLIHFRGGEYPVFRGLWDVSLQNSRSGELSLMVFDFLRGLTRRPSPSATIPIGEWFHIQFYLKRAADATGAVALYLNGRMVLEARDLVTDDTDFGQWYVGNLAEGLMPVNSTLYVDDVTIGANL